MSNVYLHYVLDLWFEKVIKPQCRGEACLLRYADDYICAFESRAEAERFYAALGPRLEKFGLTLAAEKTRILPSTVTSRLARDALSSWGLSCTGDGIARGRRI